MADKLRKPLNAPPGIQAAPGVQPGVSNGLVVAQYVIIHGQAGGVFVYSGTPKLGNLPVAWISSGLVDPFGNVLPEAGIVSDNGSGQVVALVGGALQLNAAQTASLYLSGSNIFLTAPPGVFFQPQMPIFTTYGTTADPTLITTDTWTAATVFGAGWASSGSGVGGVWFRLESDGNIHWIADVHTTSAAPSTTVCTIPAAYVPSSDAVCAGPLVPTGGTTAFAVEVFTSGVFLMPEVPAVNGVRYAGGGWYPLASL